MNELDRRFLDRLLDALCRRETKPQRMMLQAQIPIKQRFFLKPLHVFVSGKQIHSGGWTLQTGALACEPLIRNVS